MASKTRRLARIGDLPICTTIRFFSDGQPYGELYETQGSFAGNEEIAGFVKVLPVGHDRRHCDVPASCEVEVIG